MKRPVIRPGGHRPATGRSAEARPARIRLGALLAVAVAVVGTGTGMLTACGGDGGDVVGGPSTTQPPPSAALDGLTFGLREVLGRPLEPDTGVMLSFEEGRATARAGCNTMSGPYRIDGSVLRVGPELASTTMGCEPPLMEQDRWLAAFLTSGPAMSRSGTELILRSGPVTMRLAAPEERPPAPVIGTLWVLDSITLGDTVSNVPTGADRPTLEIYPSGEASVFTSCNRGRAHVEVEGSRATFGPLGLTKTACKGPAGEVEAAVVAVLEGEVELRTEADRLFVTKGDHGLIYRAAE